MGFAPTSMQLTSTAFIAGGPIPSKYTGEGEDVSPPLAWTEPPEGTQAFALICHDPDAPLVSPGSYGFVHWVLYNIPGDRRALPEGVTEHTNGRTDFGKQQWNGPMPPRNHGPHHYFFWLFALDRALDLEPGLAHWELLQRIEPHTLGMNRLMGTYERQ